MSNLRQNLYNLGIDIIAFFAKIGIILILPFKFIQFFIEAWRKNKGSH